MKETGMKFERHHWQLWQGGKMITDWTAAADGRINRRNTRRAASVAKFCVENGKMRPGDYELVLINPRTEQEVDRGTFEAPTLAEII